MKFVEPSENIQKETFEILLNEFIEEQRNANKINSDVVSAINQLTNKVTGFYEKLEQKEKETAVIDFTSLEDILRKGIAQIQLTGCTKPKSITKKFQILLFPERDAQHFYKIVFGRWFMWMAIMLLFSFLYRWMIYHEDKMSDLRTKEFDNIR